MNPTDRSFKLALLRFFLPDYWIEAQRLRKAAGRGGKMPLANHNVSCQARKEKERQKKRRAVLETFSSCFSARI